MIKRLKRALAGFLKDELLDYIKGEYNSSMAMMYPEYSMKIDQIPMDCYKCSKVVDLDSLQDTFMFKGVRPQDIYDKILHETKKDFANQIVDKIQVGSINLQSHLYPDVRGFELYLYVGSNK